jgi:UDPglucose 6-dehydrogenase
MQKLEQCVIRGTKIMTQQHISIVGTGYVGLCTAIGFATKGYKVITSTHNPEKAASINKGIPPFYEPGLQEPMQKAVKNGYLKCTLDREEATLDADITFIATATPSRPNGSINLQHIKNSAREIAKALNKKDTYHLVVVKSTVVPGTTQNIVKPTLEKYSNKQCGVGFGLCMNPEFLREGNAIYDTLHPDYIVIGEHDKKSGDTLEEFYKQFYGKNNPPIIRTNLPTAELIKYANNAFLATKISLINTFANICEKIPGADVKKIAEAIGKDHRINPHFLNAGLGWGGSCFPKDLKALIAHSKKLGYNPTLIQAANKANQDQIKFTIQKVKKELKTLKGKRIAILGLSFKPGTDDIREARSTKIINQLLREGAKITAYDPMAMPNVKTVFKEKIKYASSPTKCLKNADCAILVTEWEEFKKLKPEDFTQNMREPILIDGRRIYDPQEFSKKLHYIAIGLGEPLKPQL